MNKEIIMTITLKTVMRNFADFLSDPECNLADEDTFQEAIELLDVCTYIKGELDWKVKMKERKQAEAEEKAAKALLEMKEGDDK